MACGQGYEWTIRISPSPVFLPSRRCLGELRSVLKICQRFSEGSRTRLKSLSQSPLCGSIAYPMLIFLKDFQIELYLSSLIVILCILLGGHFGRSRSDDLAGLDRSFWPVHLN